MDRLEALGISPDGTGFVRVVAASHRPMIDLFFTAGVDVNAAGERGRTPLLAAALARDWVSATRLVEGGADVLKADEDGVTPLMTAAVGGRVEILEELLRRGARAETPDRSGHTALHYAVAARQQAAVDLLLQTNVPAGGACCEGHNLATHAFSTRDPKIISSVLAQSEPLPRWSGEACELLTAALRNGDLEFAKFLISKHAAPPVPAERSQPYVAHAVVANDIALLRKLLDCGASPSATLDAPGDESFRKLISANFVRHYAEKEPGITPLMIAAGLGRIDCVKLLLERGANRLQATRGRTKLLALYFAGWAESPEAIQLLVGGKPPSRSEMRVEVDLSRQKVTVLKQEIPVFSSSISSGTRNKPTPVGEFVITDKDIDHRSSIYNRAPMPFFMRLSCRDFGLHQGHVTGRPASHGCIRLPSSAARKLYSDLPIGTWVSVFH